MLPVEFDYVRPHTLDEALAVLTERGEDAKLLAGGHSLLPMMKLRVLTPELLVDIGGLRDLAYIREDKGEVAVGALTTHHAVESSDLLHEGIPLLPECASRIGDVQVRNRGTIGGSLAHADPAADYPAAVLALDASVVASGAAGTRSIAAGEFFQGMLETSLAPKEVLTEVRFSLPPPGSGGAYLKAPNRASYFPIVGVAAIIRLDRDGACSSARIAVTGASFTAYRAGELEERLIGVKLTEEAVSEVAHLATAGRPMLSDVWASADFRAHLCAVYARRAVLLAASRATPGN